MYGQGFAASLIPPTSKWQWQACNEAGEDGVLYLSSGTAHPHIPQAPMDLKRRNNTDYLLRAEYTSWGSLLHDMTLT